MDIDTADLSAVRGDFTISLARLNRVGPKTRKGYDSGIRKVLKWINENGIMIFSTLRTDIRNDRQDASRFERRNKFGCI